MIHPVIINPVVNPVVNIFDPVGWRADPVGWRAGPTIPDNAIYANGEAIPDPSGTGYLTYGATT